MHSEEKLIKFEMRNLNGKIKGMQETLFDMRGSPVAYIDYDDEDIIFLWNGSPVAYLDYESNIYGFNGRHLGWFEDGIVWNLNGEKNGFNKDTIAVPVFVNNEPCRAAKKFKPFRTFKEFTRFKSPKKTTGSSISLAQFLAKGKK